MTTLCVDLGQPDLDHNAVKAKALKVGAKKALVIDARKDFVTNYIFPAIQANAIYEDRYLMGTSLARYPIAKTAIDVALAEGATAVSHGATGKGNDQVRFELTFNALAPHLQVVTPWRDPAFFDRFQGRDDLMAYAKEKGIPVSHTKAKPYSSARFGFRASRADARRSSASD